MKYLLLIITLASCCANKSQTTKQFTLQIERDYLGYVTREIRTYKRDTVFINKKGYTIINHSGLPMLVIDRRN